MRRIALFFLLFVVLIMGCTTGILGSATSQAEDVYENDLEIQIFFCPRENCSSVILDNIINSNSKVHCAFFDLDLENIAKTLAIKSQTADVKVIIDKNNYKNQIKGDGVKVANSRQYMHNKFCTIDENTVLTGSTNPTNNGVNFNNNNLIIIKSNHIAENYEDEFDELWNGIYASGDEVQYEKIISDDLTIENYFCPEDNCKERVIDAINQAKHDIHFMTFSFTDEEIGDAILSKNIGIKGIFDSTGSGSQYSQYRRFKDFNIEVKKDKNKKAMHHKVFIIDSRTVITGSFNPTGSGNFRNDENILIIHNEDVAKEFLQEFDLLWN